MKIGWVGHVDSHEELVARNPIIVIAEESDNYSTSLHRAFFSELVSSSG
jgi:hypothetical protein